MHRLIGRVLLAWGLTLLWFTTAWAVTENQEAIWDQPYVIFCNNFDARALGQGDFARSTYERAGAVPAGASRTAWGESGVGGSLGWAIDNLMMPGMSFAPRSLWWVYKSYEAMSGNVVSVTPGSDADGTASITNGQAVLVLGRDSAGGYENVTVQFQNLQAAPGFSGVAQVNVVANYFPNSGTNPLAAMTQPINTTYSVSNNAVSGTLPNFAGYDAYQVILTPASGGDTVPPAPQPYLLFAKRYSGTPETRGDR